MSDHKGSPLQDMPIPVTILTGFLGAGKTSLLNQLIANHPEKKLAIIENEFGEVPIDGDLVIGAQDNIFELANGCICCSLNGELIETLRQLLDSGKVFDHLIIETTGMAEPDAVALSFVSDPGIQAEFQLDGTVCLVDAVSGQETLLEREEAVKQITFADCIVINKANDVQEHYLAALQSNLREMNPLAQITTANYGRTEANLLHLQAYEAGELEQKIKSVVGDSPTHHHHHSDVAAHSFTFDQPFDLLAFIHWSKVLLMIQGKNIYRIKGILDVGNENAKMVFQSVRTQSAFTRAGDWPENEPRLSRIVIIGKNLKREALEKALRSCLSKG
ncbi:CobW family GTP-binding protein [Haliscomenobacter hydrossis]|uniref:Cobalamin synthesis protein P47K n=1 Tax=Haliscomenobacter hydrossis (strain ATCC 27775 / DSM 1100 / LMG 10767 / O) TaxID=760192 RepID=F4KZ47_HALH1|nr:GTP-binding protein [Haliscomenobacter hydrossis]AEE53701.1 cobalamin synthesis protein P47K [Haliscomenobacter hydrossis DSM 1100]